jgi:hypothetical protein
VILVKRKPKKQKGNESKSGKKRGKGYDAKSLRGTKRK